MKSKHWSHREYWLINVNHIGTDFLQDIASIDIDDNVFVYFSKEDVIEVYEAYRIHPSMPLEFGEYLSWERGFASRSLTLSKYIRRKNMKVNIYKYLSWLIFNILLYALGSSTEDNINC